MMSTYFGIKQICTLPVESICTGGIFWFQNLAATDPYYILPLISASTLFIMIQVCVIGKLKFVQMTQ